jgi:hypothetical protein
VLARGCRWCLGGEERRLACSAHAQMRCGGWGWLSASCSPLGLAVTVIGAIVAVLGVYSIPNYPINNYNNT